MKNTTVLFTALAAFDMNLIPEMGPNGERYYLPVGTSNITTVLFMNTELVESLGFSKPETYEDIAAMVPASQEAGLEVITIDGADGWAWGSCLLSALIARTSGDPDWVSKAVKGEYSFDDKAMVNALGLIAAPVIKNYQPPSNLPNELVQKVLPGQSALPGSVIDAHLSGDPNDALNEGIRRIVAGEAAPAEIAAKVEALARR